MTPRENELLADLVNGNRQVLGSLFSLYREPLKRMVDLHLDPRIRTRVDTSDIIQEAQLEATQRIEEFLQQAEVPFVTWIRFLTRQKLAEATRRHVHAQARDIRRESVPAPLAGDATSLALVNLLISNTTSPSSVVANDEMWRIVESAILSMEATDREILCLRHLELLTSEQAAAELGISLSACRKRHFRALQRLKELLLPLDLEFAADQ